VGNERESLEKKGVRGRRGGGEKRGNRAEERGQQQRRGVERGKGGEDEIWWLTPSLAFCPRSDLRAEEARTATG